MRRGTKPVFLLLLLLSALLSLLPLCSASSPYLYHHDVRPNTTSTCSIDIEKLGLGAPPWDGERRVLMLASWGKGFGDLGDYLTCAQVRGAVYSWVAPTFAPASPGVSLGLCVPASCNDESLPPALSLIAGILPCINETVTGEYNVVSHIVERRAPLDGPGAKAAAGIMSAVAACVLLATVLDACRRRRLQSSDEHHHHHHHLGHPEDEYDFLYDDPDDPLLVDHAAVGGEDGGAVRGHVHRESGGGGGGGAGGGVAGGGGGADGGVAGGARLPRHARAPWHARHLSLLVTLRELFSFDPRGERAGRFQALNGLRVLSSLWAIMGHTFLLAFGPLLKNRAYVERFVTRRFSFQIVLSATYASDTFLLLSAFLGAESLLRQMRGGARAGTPARWLPVSYAYRALRLLPALGTVLAIYYLLSPSWGTGPLWYLYESVLSQSCDASWYTTLLFAQNYSPAHVADACMQWSWWLAVDAQLGLLLPLFAWAYHRRKRATAAVVVALLVACVSALAAVAARDRLSPNVLYGDYVRYTNVVVTKPWARAPAYLVGLLVFFLYDRRRPASHPPRSDLLPRSYQVIGTAAALLCIFLAVFAPFHDYADGRATWHATDNVLYIAFSRTAFSAGVGIVVLLALLGRGGFIEPVLSSVFWLPLSRLAYLVNLVSPFVIAAVFMSAGDLFYYRDAIIVYYAIGSAVASVLMASLLYVFVERPALTLLRAWFAPLRRTEPAAAVPLASAVAGAGAGGAPK